MAVALCTKDHGVVSYFSIPFPFFSLSERLHICYFAFFCLFSRSLSILSILPYYSRALLRTFGDIGERFGSMELDRWEDVSWDFQSVFLTCSLYLQFCSVSTLGVGSFSSISVLKVVIFCLLFPLFDFREMASLTKT